MSALRKDTGQGRKQAHLWLSVGLIIIRRLGGDLVEHLVEPHIDDWVSLDEVLEVLNDWKQRNLDLGDFSDLYFEPSLQDAVVDWQPSAKAVRDKDWSFVGFAVVAHISIWRGINRYARSKYNQRIPFKV